jgi:hypothetical protein
MFNTVGNIASYPLAGLAFADFETGATLQLTGRATIERDPERAGSIPGAQRLVGDDEPAFHPGWPDEPARAAARIRALAAG